MALPLRQHQAQDLGSLRAELTRVRAAMLVAACGYGKGVITTHIIEKVKAKGKHVLFLVHGRDRVNDMVERVTKLGISHGVIMGSKRRSPWEPVQIASSDSVHRMPVKPPADLIIIDECHLAMSPTFRGVLNCYPKAKIIGLTATPILGTNRPLGKKSGGIFESMVVGPSVKQLISEGYLVGSRVFRQQGPSELDGLQKKRTGEYDEAQGGEICDTRKVIGDVVEHWKRHSSDRKTAAFGFTQKHAYHIAEQFREAGINWAYVDADTNDDERKQIWQDLDHGDLVGVSSVGCISVGWDHPICKSLILASKTSSFPLYHQRLGRGSRPYPGYKDFLVLDHCNNIDEHKSRGAFFESDITWLLDGLINQKEDDCGVSTCDEEVFLGDDDAPEGFTGPIENGYMLPCFATFEQKPGRKFCPECGIPLTEEVETAPIVVEAGVLEELTENDRELIEAAGISQRKTEYMQLVQLTKDRNYKPGYPAVVFKSKYGYWPPRGWKAEAAA